MAIRIIREEGDEILRKKSREVEVIDEKIQTLIDDMIETMYKYKKFMHSAYEKTKNSSKYDYSRDIIANLQDNTDYTTNYFYKLIAAFFVILIMIISGFVYLYL